MPLYTRFNKGYHYIITIVDVLSKYVWAVPLKTKSGNDVATIIAKIIRNEEEDVRKVCRLTEEKNFTMQTCRNS